MQSSVNVEINMFGMLSQYSGTEPLVLKVSRGLNMKEILGILKEELSKKFSDFNAHKVIDASVLADESEILRRDHIITKDVSLVVLPPVCGG